MNGVTGPTGVIGSHQVHERQAGGQQQQADAFRRAMQEQGNGDDDERQTEAQKSLRRALQRRAPNGRKDDGEAHHVDVVA